MGQHGMGKGSAAASLAFKPPAGTRARPRLLASWGKWMLGLDPLTAREHSLTCASTNASMHMPAQQLSQVAADPPRQEEDSWGGGRAEACLGSQDRQEATGTVRGRIIRGVGRLMWLLRIKCQQP